MHPQIGFMGCLHSLQKREVEKKVMGVVQSPAHNLDVGNEKGKPQRGAYRNE
jgi:hypothetical protein